MTIFTKALTVLLLSLTLTSCTVTTKSEDITLSDRAWSSITIGCSEFAKGNLTEAGPYFAEAAQLNPEYIPILEKFNLILNFWISNPNRLETEEFMSLYCSAN
jgi:hypothetical protein